MNKPQIRFKGFEDEWTSRSLSELGEVKMCKRILKSQTSEKGDVPFFKIGTFGKEPDAFISRELFEEFKRLYSYPKIGDIIVSAAGTIGRISVFDGKPAYFQDSNLIWIDNDNSIIDNSFLAVAYPRIKWAISSTTIARIYNDTVRQTSTTAPTSLKEQCEIGTLFSKINELLTEAEREVSRLEKMKQASLQKMFPRPGATTPKIRFDGFTEPWPLFKLDNILGYYQPQPYIVKSSKYTDNGIPVLTAGKSFILGYSKENYGIYSDLPIILFDDFTTDKRFVDFPFKVKSSAAKILFLKSLDYDLYFIFQMMLNLPFDASNHRRYWISDYSQLQIPIPSLNEQRKIADYFRNLDSLLSAKRQKLVKLRNIKQACLDKMFVNTSEL